MTLKQEFSEESDLRDLPRKDVTEDSVVGKVSKMPRKGLLCWKNLQNAINVTFSF